MIYVTEIADKEIRASLGMTVQVMNSLGSLTIYSIGPFISYMALNSIVLSIPIIYLLACVWIPESPYYHLKDERIEAARKEFKKLKGTSDEKVSRKNVIEFSLLKRKYHSITKESKVISLSVFP